MNLINETDYKEISNCLNDIINIVFKKEKNRLYQKIYNKQKNKWKQSLKGKKSRRIYNWKKRGFNL
jgi:hypothetical protein